MQLWQPSNQLQSISAQSPKSSETLTSARRQCRHASVDLLELASKQSRKMIFVLCDSLSKREDTSEAFGKRPSFGLRLQGEMFQMQPGRFILWTQRKLSASD